MNRSVSLPLMLFILVSVLIGAAAEAVTTESVPRMTQEEAKSMLGNPDIIFIDVRAPHDWEASGSKIKGAVREDPSNISAWAEKYPKDKTLLFYCA